MKGSTRVGLIIAFAILMIIAFISFVTLFSGLLKKLSNEYVSENNTRMSISGVTLVISCVLAIPIMYLIDKYDPVNISRNNKSLNKDLESTKE